MAVILRVVSKVQTSRGVGRVDVEDAVGSTNWIFPVDQGWINAPPQAKRLRGAGRMTIDNGLKPRILLDLDSIPNVFRLIETNTRLFVS